MPEGRCRRGRGRAGVGRGGGARRRGVVRRRSSRGLPCSCRRLRALGGCRVWRRLPPLSRAADLADGARWQPHVGWPSPSWVLVRTRRLVVRKPSRQPADPALGRMCVGAAAVSACPGGCRPAGRDPPPIPLDRGGRGAVRAVAGTDLRPSSVTVTAPGDRDGAAAGPGVTSQLAPWSAIGRSACAAPGPLVPLAIFPRGAYSVSATRRTTHGFAPAPSTVRSTSPSSLPAWRCSPASRGRPGRAWRRPRSRHRGAARRARAP